jgi:hypothetical protein
MDGGRHRKFMVNVYQIGKLRITAIAGSRPAAIGRLRLVRWPRGPGIAILWGLQAAPLRPLSVASRGTFPGQGLSPRVTARIIFAIYSITVK